MALNFPSTPSLNDTYSYNGKTWVFNGSAWIQSRTESVDITVTGNVAANSFIGDGSQLTGLPAGYTDSNVETVLSGNITVGNVTVTGTIDGYATTTYVDTEVANLVASAPSTLDTLNELASALGNDPNLSTTLTSLIGNNSANITVLQGNITSIESDITNLEANIPANLQSNVTTLESDVSTLQGNIVTLDNQVANLNYYDDTNVTTFLSDIGSNSITTTGNVTADYFIGNGSQLTGINVSGGSVTTSNAAPSSPNDGDVWFDTESGKQFTYINDGDSSQWVETQAHTSLSLGDANVKTYLASFDGNIVPSANVTYYLGSETQQWHSLYVGPGSLYVNGKKVLEDDSGKITVTTSVNQNLAVKTSGTGNIELFADGTGVINLQSNVQVDSGASLYGIGGLKFSSNINLDQNHINNLDNPISAQDAATKFYVDTEIANLVNSAPAALDTLNELAAALGNDSNFSTTVTNLIGNNSANITSLQSSITTVGSNITALQSDVTAIESNVTALQGNVATAESDITALQGNVATVESDVAALQESINDTPIGNVTPSSGSFTTLNSSGDTVLGPIAGHFIPAANGTYDLGSSTYRWNTLYLMGNTIDLGGARIKSDATEGTIALIPSTPAGNTRAIVIGQRGISTVETDEFGEVSAEAISEAANAANTITGNLTATEIKAESYFFANGDPMLSSAAVRVGRRSGGPMSVRMASGATIAVIGRNGTTLVSINV